MVGGGGGGGGGEEFQLVSGKRNTSTHLAKICQIKYNGFFIMGSSFLWNLF